MKYLAILLLFASCHSFNEQALKTSLEVNQITLESYQDVSDGLKYLVEDIIKQFNEQGKDITAISYYLSIVKKNNLKIADINKQLRDAIMKIKLNDTNYQNFIIDYLNAIVLLYGSD
jgi:hypothetical protein